MTDTFKHYIAAEQRAEAAALDTVFRDVTGWTPKLWGKVIGYGSYDYRYDSGHEGTSFATGFHVRARDVALHIMPGYRDFEDIAVRLGPHKRGKSCWYIKCLADVDETTVRDLIQAGLDDLRTQWPITPSESSRCSCHRTCQ